MLSLCFCPSLIKWIHSAVSSLIKESCNRGAVVHVHNQRQQDSSHSGEVDPLLLMMNDKAFPTAANIMNPNQKWKQPHCVSASEPRPQKSTTHLWKATGTACYRTRQNFSLTADVWVDGCWGWRPGGRAKRRRFMDAVREDMKLISCLIGQWRGSHSAHLATSAR